MRKQSPRRPPSVAWQFGLASLTNSRYLVGAAKELLKAGYFGPARSLAISAREEVGKFFQLLPRALELPETANGGDYDHRRKQALGAIFAFLPQLARFDSLTFDIGAAASVDDILARFPEQFSRIAEGLTFDETALPALVDSMESAMGGGHERVRQAGLYIDLDYTADGWQLQDPQSVSPEDAQAEIDRAEAFSSFSSFLSSQVRVDPTLDELPLPDVEALRQVLAKIVRPIWCPP